MLDLQYPQVRYETLEVNSIIIGIGITMILLHGPFVSLRWNIFIKGLIVLLRYVAIATLQPFNSCVN
jgi:hypothetical protein